MSGLTEKFDGIQFASQIPFNFHNSLSSNHTLRMSLSLQKRSVQTLSDEYDYDINEFIPRNSDEFNELPFVKQQGVTLSLPFENNTRRVRKDFREYSNKENMEMVEEWAHEDFREYG